MNKTVTRGQNGAIAEPKCAIAQNLLIAAGQRLRYAVQMVLDGARRHFDAQKSSLTFDGGAGLRRLRHVDLGQLGESSDYD
jgi:hypothetical protein